VHPETLQSTEVLSMEVSVGDLLPDFQAYVRDLPVGMGFKGGIARKLLKLLVGCDPQSEMMKRELKGEYDADIVVTVDHHGPDTSRLVRKALTGKPIGPNKITPEDIEVITIERLQSYYWNSRDISQNEVLLFRTAPEHVFLFFTPEAREDSLAGNIRRVSRCLMNDYCLMWRCDNKGKPIWTSICLARALVRYFKGHGKKVMWDKATQKYYRKRKLTVTDAFRVLRPFYDPKVALKQQPKFPAVCKKLKEWGLLPGGKKAAAIWKTKVERLEKICPGKVNFDQELSIEDIEEWAHQKKDSVKEMRENIVLRAPERGFVESDKTSEVKCAPELAQFSTPLVSIHEDGTVKPNAKTNWADFTG